jgi:tetratricopeptide (TPR) repeat protein
MQTVDSDDHANILLRRAAAGLAANQLESAIEDLEEARECNPTDPDLQAEIRIQLGKIYQQQKKFELAENEFTEAINCDPTENQESIYFLRGQVRIELGKFGMAIVDFTMAMEFVPPKCEARAELLLHRGWAQIEMSNKKEAFQDWDEGLECDLENGLVKARLLYAKCEIYRRDQDYAQVINNATAALACEFDDKELTRDLYRIRGGAHRMAKHFKEAIDDWSKALDFEFENPDDKAAILYAKGVALQKNNELFEARKDWLEALKYVTNEELRQLIQGRLDQKISTSSSISLLAGWAWSKIPSSPFSSPNKEAKH